jgi:hypothetical protein
MRRQNPYISCPECATSNKDTNWQCWKCKKEGQVTELTEVGGADPPWAGRGTVFGGKMREAAGTSAYSIAARRNPVDPEVGQRIAENIFQINPDSVELERGVSNMDFELDDIEEDDDLDIEEDDDLEEDGDDLDIEENDELDIDTPVSITSRYRRHNPWRRRNTAPAWGGPLYRRNPCCCGKDGCNCACNGTEARCACRKRNCGIGLRRNSQAPVWGGPLFHRNRRNPLRRRNAQAPVWGGPLFRNRRRNAQAPVWGGPLYRRNRRNPLRRRNAQAPVWGGPLYRRNSARLWGADGKWSSSSRRRNAQAPVWGGPLYRKNPMAKTARWEPCAKCGLAVCDGTCSARNSQAPVWGGPLYRRRLRRNPSRRSYRRNSDAAWDTPLFRRNS